MAQGGVINHKGVPFAFETVRSQVLKLWELFLTYPLHTHALWSSHGTNMEQDGGCPSRAPSSGVVV